MDIKDIKKYVPELTDRELNEISSASLNRLFSICSIPEGEIFIPKKGYVYRVVEGKILVSGYVEGDLELNMQFEYKEYLGMIDLFQIEVLDYIAKGLPSAKLLEIPAGTALENASPKYLLDIHRKMSRNMVNNILKLFKVYAAKVNFTNEQFFVNFLLTNKGSFEFSSTEELSQLLHIDIRTLQRVIKKLTENGIIIREGKIISIIDTETAEELLET